MANKILDRLKKESIKDTEWIVEAQYRRDNAGWLDLSFSIAVRALSAMKKNGITQKDLAAALKCSPQYVSKLLKGKEKINVETIDKLQKALKITLVQVPDDSKVKYQKPAYIPIYVSATASDIQKKSSYEQERSTTIHKNKWRHQKTSTVSNC